MIICFQFDSIYFVQFNLHLIGRKVNLQAVIFKRVKFDKSFWTFSFDLFVQFEEFVQLDVACPMKPKQTRKHMPCRRLLQRRDPLISRGRATGAAATRGPTASSTRVDRPRRLKKIQGRRKPSFSSHFASQTTPAPTRWRLRSEVRSLYPGRCWPRGAFGRRQPTHDIPRAIASVRCWKNESAADRRAPGRKRSVASLVGSQRVSWPCASFEFRMQTGPSSIWPNAVFFSNFYSVTKNIIQLRSSIRPALYWQNIKYKKMKYGQSKLPREFAAFVSFCEFIICWNMK